MRSADLVFVVVPVPPAMLPIAELEKLASALAAPVGGAAAVCWAPSPARPSASSSAGRPARWRCRGRRGHRRIRRRGGHQGVLRAHGGHGHRTRRARRVDLRQEPARPGAPDGRAVRRGQRHRRRRPAGAAAQGRVRAQRRLPLRRDPPGALEAHGQPARPSQQPGAGADHQLADLQAGDRHRAAADRLRPSSAATTSSSSTTSTTRRASSAISSSATSAASSSSRSAARAATASSCTSKAKAMRWPRCSRSTSTRGRCRCAT